MKKSIFFLLLFFTSNIVEAQVGINTTIPNAQLDIRSSNQASPSNTDGILIPKVNVFPVTNPTAAQQGMLVYLTTTAGTDLPGFYYWDNPTTDWKPITGTSVGTLDQAYDFGGAGNGKTITADAGAVTIEGTDGFVATGTFGSGAIAPSGAGTRMVWNPRKGAFRAGNSVGNEWDDASLGNYSAAFGLNNTASANNSFATGIGTTASGVSSFGAGFNTVASGDIATAFGYETTASGEGAVAFGNSTDATGYYATSFGSGTTASGIYSTTFGLSTTASAQSSVAFGTQTIANGSSSASFGQQSSASGNVSFSFGQNTGANASYSAAFGYWSNSSGDSSFVAGRNSSAGGDASSCFGESNSALGNNSFAAGRQNTASGINSTVFGQSTTASGNISTAFGLGNSASGTLSTVFGNLNFSSGNFSTAFGVSNTASGIYSTVFGQGNEAFGEASTAFGQSSVAMGSNSTSLGRSNQAVSFGETVVGIGATTYIASTNGNTQFRAANSTDRLFVIGNAIDVNNNDLVDAAERSNAMVVLKNGNTGFGTSTPQTRVHVVGNLRMVDGNQAAGRVLTSDINGTATWQNASANAWGLIGNAGTNATTNFIGTTDNVDLVFRRFNTLAGRIGTSNTFFGRLSGSVATGNNNTYIGTEAGRDNVSGQQNVYIGRRAGTLGATGSDNIFIGNGAGILNEANQNCFTGSFSGNGTTTGANNSFYGYSSGNTTGTGSQNAFFGAFAGMTNSVGIGNTLLGTNSNVGSNNLTNASAIGFNSMVNASNSLVLGSVNGVNGATSNVKVGIGTTTPVGDLELRQPDPILRIAADDTNSSFLQLYEMTAGFPFGYMFEYDGNLDKLYLYSKGFAGNDGIRMTWLKTGNVGIGTLNPGGQLELSLNEGRKPGTNTWTIVSDQRLKTINGNYTKGLNEILQLNPIRFNYKNNGERTFEQKVLDTEFPGFIAQEVQPIFPDAVGTDADGFLNFNIHPILIASVNAIQELNAKNTQLQSENQTLKAELDQQKALLESVLQRIAQLEQN